MTAHGLRQQVGRVGDFVRFVYPTARKKSLLALGVLLLAGLTEGVSILLLVPILAGLVPGSTEIVMALPQSIGGGGNLRMDLGAVLIALVGVVIAQALFMRVSSLIMVDTVLAMTDRVRLTLFGSISLSRYRHLIKARHADLNHAVTTDVERVQAVLNSLFLLAQGVFMLSVYMVASLVISPAMTVIAVLFGLVFLAILHPIRRYASAYGERVTLQRQAQYRTVGEFLGGLKLVKSLNAEPRYLRSFQANMEGISGEVRRFFRVSAIPTVLFQVMSASGAAAFVFVAIRYLNMPLERVAVLLFLLMRISPRFTSIQTSIQQILLNIGGYVSIKRLIVDCGQEQEALSPRKQETMSLRTGIRFEEVGFRYVDEGPDVLSNLSFTVPAGEITAVIGPSGGGKSTLADLMLGLLEPSAGRIVVDTVPLNGTNLRHWRTAVAYVPQEVFLSHDTVAANLRLADPWADEAALWRALSQAQAASFVIALPQGLQTIVGERGTRMSGGERQRIALARALLARPRLLVLDEATSALDWQNQNLIAQAIEALRGEMTIITIAHRPSMIAFADWVIAIDGGRVVETGAFSEILAREDSRLARLMAGETTQAADPGQTLTGRPDETT